MNLSKMREMGQEVADAMNSEGELYRKIQEVFRLGHLEALTDAQVERIVEEVLDEARSVLTVPAEKIREDTKIEEQIKGMNGFHGFQQAYFRVAVERDYLRKMITLWFGSSGEGDGEK